MLVIGILISINSPILAEPSPQISLAKIYQKTEQINQYWVSEKLDGVRAFWDGENLISRQGNRFQAPSWFTDQFPDQKLDGELWIAKGTFEQLMSTVSKDLPIDSEWQKVKYMVFDLPEYGSKNDPESKSTFSERLKRLDQIISDHKNPYLHLIKQTHLSDHEQLMTKLDQIVKNGGEGLMLHLGDSFYKTGRTDDILKVKKHQDAEAIVIAHLPGKGKYQNMLGALLVEMPDGKRFKIGTGFKDLDRKNPPAIGSKITYKYFGLTRKGIPKFASFLRIRN